MKNQKESVQINIPYKFSTVKEAYEESRKYERNNCLPRFPPYVTFEITNKCNFECVMCASTYMKPRKKEIGLRIFKKLIDEISQYGSVVRFIGFGEPFLYSNIREAIRYVKSKGLLLHITTNGSLLNTDYMEVLLENQVDSIIFSFQGLTKEEYCLMRGRRLGMYEKVLNNIKKLYSNRKHKRPYIKITTTITQRDNPEDKESFISFHLQHSNEVQITGFTNFFYIDKIFAKSKIWHTLNILQPDIISGVKCYLPNYEILVKADGNVYACCGAFTNDLLIGSYQNKTLFDIFHSDKAHYIRKELERGNLDRFKDCSVCSIRIKHNGISNPISAPKKGL